MYAAQAAGLLLGAGYHGRDHAEKRHAVRSACLCFYSRPAAPGGRALTRGVLQPAASRAGRAMGRPRELLPICAQYLLALPRGGQSKGYRGRLPLPGALSARGTFDSTRAFPAAGAPPDAARRPRREPARDLPPVEPQQALRGRTRPHRAARCAFRPTPAVSAPTKARAKQPASNTKRNTPRPLLLPILQRTPASRRRRSSAGRSTGMCRSGNRRVPAGITSLPPSVNLAPPLGPSPPAPPLSPLLRPHRSPAPPLCPQFHELQYVATADPMSCTLVHPQQERRPMRKPGAPAPDNMIATGGAGGGFPLPSPQLAPASPPRP